MVLCSVLPKDKNLKYLLYLHSILNFKLVKLLKTIELLGYFVLGKIFWPALTFLLYRWLVIFWVMKSLTV